VLKAVKEILIKTIFIKWTWNERHFHGQGCKGLEVSKVFK